MRTSQQAKEALLSSHPTAEQLNTAVCQLRYIDAIDFDYEQRDIFSFLREEMRLSIGLPPELFGDTSVSKSPREFDLSFAFSSQNPSGTMRLRFARGARGGKDALIWETALDSSNEDPPSIQDSDAWAAKAHTLTHDWFFKIIDGKLLESFK